MRTPPAAPADKGPDFDLEFAKFSARQMEAVKLRITPKQVSPFRKWLFLVYR